MKQFLEKYGKALDVSGAFFASVAGVISSYYGFYPLALGFWLGAVAFFASWRAWNAPDNVEWRFNRTMCVLFAVGAAIVFLASAVSWVLA